MEMTSPPSCPVTVTVRRNPHRKARATPSSAVPFHEPPLSPPSFSRNIFAAEIVQNPNNADHCKTDPSTTSLPENLKVFLRIRPLAIQKNSKTVPELKNAWPKNPKIKSNSRPKTKKSSEMCVQVNEDLHSVTVSTPKPLQEMKRIKSEVYEGFSQVFSAESSQNDVYEQMVKPLVEDFLKGKSGMLAAMGPSGSGKTHTVFGCAREPGMLPLALRHIFSGDGSSGAHLSREVYLSMFEISSERGKSEKMIDLLHDGGDVSMQHSVIKGLQEAAVTNAQQAESLIARGMLKRATAMTNSNSQSSRSQCIINIRRCSEQTCEELDDNTRNNTVLTIVDLAGAEREKRTGNQGARLLESNFINNTSMVFGQCLRSLLEHQRNRSKTLQKHYKNSLLTRYLRDYLEGKKRMMLILTIKPGVEDYLDTSFLLRQASPFAKIKFKIVEETVTLTNKRPNQALTQAGQLKKMKFGNNETSLIDEGKTDRSFPQNSHKEFSGKAVDGCLSSNSQDINDENIDKIHALSNGLVGLGIQERMLPKGIDKLKIRKEKEFKIMQGLSKAMWNVLKQYKEKLEGAEIENGQLRDSLANEKTRSMHLENELTNTKLRIFHLEKLAETPEVNSDIVSPSVRHVERTENEKVADPSAVGSIATFASSYDGGDDQHPQQREDLLQISDDTENTKGFRDTSEVNMSFRTNILSTSINCFQEIDSFEDTGTVDCPSTSATTIESTSRLLCTNYKSEQEALSVVRDVKNFESESGDITSTSEAIQSTSGFFHTIHDSTEDAVNFVGDMSGGIPSTSEASIQSTSRFRDASHKSEQDATNVVGDVKTLESESESAMGGSCLVTSLECKSDENTEGHEYLEDAKQELHQFQNDNSMLNVPMEVAHLHADLKSSKSPRNGDTSDHVKEEGTLEPPSIVLPNEGLDAQHMPKVASGSNRHAGKPRRRLQPASSVLLKDLSMLDIKDENDKSKGGKAGKRATADEKSRTQGMCWKHLLFEATKVSLHLLTDHFVA